ncbi:Crp/Fnr family transcriptional regulator [Alteromonas pelagimontana]|uniref:Crp/Fnr family transcriptional regulator n=1 Tax=Alteromonas pelagimontana TaxID=1858656 RepID=A0A6M4MF01_9ALTE|nr:Crp/Fnr family transcriptional regulator [Alteromonas pelagimontana]QJR81682.1 Crp/Fnr family transcriptional regulator [Alteromonas pelagimontana]
MPYLKGLQQNQMLAILPLDVQERLYPYMDLVNLPLGKVLYEPGDILRYAYFPSNCIVSLLHGTQSGACAEIAMIGSEGLVGIPLCMGGDSTISRALVQSSGHAYRIPGQRLKDEFNLHGILLNTVLRYTQTLITQMSQTAVCNSHHSIEQRFCRWLLMALDRLQGNELVITQETIANMLGVRREGVTEAAGRLQRMGAIKYHRGHIYVLNRSQLESLSCECYGVVRKEAQRLLPWLNNATRIVPIHRVTRVTSATVSASAHGANI